MSVDDSLTSIRLQPEQSKGTGLAFYPGAKVDPQAYVHVLRPVAEAGYPVNNMADRVGLEVTSVSATEVGLATVSDIDDSVAELPPSTRFVPVVGAIHSYFGDYGLQSGDGTPSISREEAQAQIADASVGFLDDIDAAGG